MAEDQKAEIQNYEDLEPDKRPDMTGAAQVTESDLRTKEGKKKVKDGVIFTDRFGNYWDVSARHDDDA
jgi:hypothetical protein